MRIIGGRWRGRRIGAPPGDLVRPTGDRMREAWMSILGARIPNARVLDLFAGTGALGLESLSRGAASVEFVEREPRSLEVLKANVEQLGAAGSVSIHRGDAIVFASSLPAGAYDLAFADPPYGTGLAQQVAAQWIAVAFAGILGVEHRRGEEMPGEPDTRSYGTAAVSFYRRDPQAEPSGAVSQR